MDSNCHLVKARNLKLHVLAHAWQEPQRLDRLGCSGEPDQKQNTLDLPGLQCGLRCTGHSFTHCTMVLP